MGMDMQSINTKNQLMRELFKYDVRITPSQFPSGGDTYRWTNYCHPDNPNFGQLVFWIAYPNHATNTVSVKYQLCRSGDKYYPAAILPIEDSVEETIFNFWGKQKVG